jgi:hypothetical protein
MFRVSPDLNLELFVGARLVNIGLGLNNTLFIFEVKALDYAEINAEGRWEVVDQSGRVVSVRPRDEDSRHQAGVTLQLTDLLGRCVDGTALSPPESLELHLTGDIRLRFYDDSDEFESMTIRPGNYVI